MSSHHSHAQAVLAVVHEPGGARPGAPLVFELCGPLGAAEAEAVADRVAARHRAYTVTLDDDGTGRRLVRLAPTGTASGERPPALSADLLADLLAPLSAGTVPVTGYQRELLLAAVTRQGGPGRHIEQLCWNWTGPLDTTRFTAAWHSVADRETVLRASFDWTGAPLLVLHDHAPIEVVRHRHATVAWSELLRRDRLRGFELHRPGLLRVTLLDGPPQRSAPARGPGHGPGPGPLPGARAATGPAPTRVLLSYHSALLDGRGAHLLVREFYRAYLADGVVPGGERRPDIRDHAAWLQGRDTEAARRYWAAAAPPADAAVRPGRDGGRTRFTGAGRIQRRLRPHQTSRLRSWAALWGAGESSALHVVWALLLYRAADARGPVPVSFGVHFSGRDLTLEGAADVPGLLGNPLPMTVTVDPAAPLVDLLRQVRDAALDLSSYPWVSGDRILQWSGREEAARLADTLVRFDSRPELPEVLRAELKAQGIQVDVPQSASGDTSLPVTLVAQYDADGGLLLTATYDRAELSDADASGVLSQCMELLRRLSDQQDERVTVGQVLGLLESGEVPRMARQGRRPRTVALAVLRPGGPHADVVCLVAVPGVPPGVYESLVQEYEGPERIVSLSLAGDVRTPPSALPELLGPGRRLVLCGCGPAGRVAYEIAQGTAARTATATTVVMTGIGGVAESARALARALESVRARTV
ncbi:condensation domain-containing protein [Streptomyces sp. NPDC059631]|uniref:condensation domain-containing protein n=1 Tax=unclassified Streptomyces TaxID=2593676 RepID=UPI0036BA0504